MSKAFTAAIGVTHKCSDVQLEMAVGPARAKAAVTQTTAVEAAVAETKLEEDVRASNRLL